MSKRATGVRRAPAADLVCNTYLVPAAAIIAGSDEVFMAIIHGMAILYRKAGETITCVWPEGNKDFEWLATTIASKGEGFFLPRL